MKVYARSVVAIFCYGFAFVHLLWATEGENAYARVNAIAESAIHDRIINGIVVLAGDADSVTFQYEKGFADFGKKYPLNADTIIDVASVTKVAATVTALLICHSRGLIDLDAPFTDYLKEFKPTLEHPPSVRDLANHMSGFYDKDDPKKRAYFDESGQKMVENVLSIAPPSAAPVAPRYSCWNYILLSMLVESVSGERFDVFCGREIFQPLGMNDTSLGRVPSDCPPSRLAQTIRTKQPGQISDLIANKIYAAGLSTGNAGMFTTANDMVKLLRCYIAKGKYGNGEVLFSEKSFNEILPVATDKIEGIRHLGWSNWEAGVPESEFGSILLHSGWSGQTVAFNAKRGTFIIVLTTRIGNYDRAKNDRFKIVSILSE